MIGNPLKPWRPDLVIHGSVRPPRWCHRSVAREDDAIVVCADDDHVARPACSAVLRANSKAIGDRMPSAECRRTVLYSSIQAATFAWAWVPVVKCSRLL